MIKRFTDILVSLFGLLVASPILLFFLVVVWLQDFQSPFYIAPRVGRGGKSFRMVKMRSMVKNADKSGIDSTKSDDQRITFVGKVLRKIKLDELTQLWNVLRGQMSLVGPRPQVRRDVELYTADEERLLSVRPGITDFSSIVFADEGDILAGSDDPDLSYQQLIRPWKSRLALLYIDKQSFWLDFRLIVLTITNAFSRRATLLRVCQILMRLGASQEMQDVCRRDRKLVPTAPPGVDEIVMSR